MTRGISTIVSNAVVAKQLDPIFAIEMFFDGGTIRLWTGYGTAVLDGVNSFTGAGQLLSITDVEETAEIKASGITVVLNGISSSIIALALDEPYQGRVCKMYFGVMSPTPSIVEMFSGYMDQMLIRENSETCDVILNVENKLINLERAKILRFSHNDQVARFPGDLGLEFVESLQTKEVYFGMATP